MTGVPNEEEEIGPQTCTEERACEVTGEDSQDEAVSEKPARPVP